MAEETRHGSAALVAPDGSSTPLTDEMYEVLAAYARKLERARRPAVVAVDYVSTGEAASMLGVSRHSVPLPRPLSRAACHSPVTRHVLFVRAWKGRANILARTAAST